MESLTSGLQVFEAFITLPDINSPVHGTFKKDFGLIETSPQPLIPLILSSFVLTLSRNNALATSPQSYQHSDQA
jgi:hypothetical protein